jgi:hypothetical protein
MVRQALFGMGLAAAVAIGCSPPATTPPPAPPATPQPPASETPAPPVSAPVVPPASATSQPPPQPAGKIAKESLPAGLSPITEAEANEAATKCKPLTEAIAAAAAKNTDKKKSPVDFTVEFLAKPPKLAGVDVARCSDIIIRDLKVRRSEMLESLAIQHLREIAISLKAAYDQQPSKLCPNAGPTPADVKPLEDKAQPSKPEDWSAEGWKCARFAPAPSVRFQYELKTDPKNLTYEIIARGYPVKGGPVSELYTQGKVGPGAPEAPPQVYRR